MDVCAVFHVVLSRKKKGEERVGVGGRGKYPGAPPHIKRKKRKKARPQGTVKRESLLKKKKNARYKVIKNCLVILNTCW
jgi:hypothetical protein